MNKIKITMLFMFACVVCMFVGSCSVNAQATTLQYSNMLTTQKHIDNNTGNSVTMQVDTNATNHLKNAGKGSVLYSFNMLNDLNTSATMPVVRSVSIGQYNCIYSTTSGFSDSSTQAYSYMVQCPVDIGSSGVTGITIKFDSFTNNSFYIFGASFISFVPEYAVLSTGDAQTLQNNILSAIINNGNYLSSIDQTLDNQELLQNQIKNSLASILTSINSNNSSIVNTITTQTNNINNNITDIKNDITSDNITGNNSSDSITSISNSFSSSDDFILNLFTLPYNFLTTIMNGVTDSCTPISLGTIFDYELVMPCINLNNWLGSIWTGVVDVVLAGMLSFAFRKRIHDFFYAICRLDRKAANIGGIEIL